MTNIVTWEYYNSLHNKVNQEEFAALEPIAEKQVALVVGHYRWNRVEQSAFYFTQLKDCICGVVNKLADLNRGGAGKGLSSISNDGYTESYAVRTLDEYNAEIRSCIVHGLSGTGLVGAFAFGGCPKC